MRCRRIAGSRTSRTSPARSPGPSGVHRERPLVAGTSPPHQLLRRPRLAERRWPAVGATRRALSEDGDILAIPVAPTFARRLCSSIAPSPSPSARRSQPSHFVRLRSPRRIAGLPGRLLQLQGTPSVAAGDPARRTGRAPATGAREQVVRTSTMLILTTSQDHK